MKSPEQWFLNAQDPEIQRIADQAEIAARILSREPTAERIHHLVEQVRQEIRPYNQVGLFSPAITNMYHHTVAPD